MQRKQDGLTDRMKTVLFLVKGVLVQIGLSER